MSEKRLLTTGTEGASARAYFANIYARGQGRRKLTLRVLGGNDGARRLYESRGFVIEGTLRGAFLLDGDYVDDHLMALDLTR